MENLENNEELTPAKKTSKVVVTEEPKLSWLEASIQARRNDLNFPALQAMFHLTEEQLQEILDKLPPVEDCNC
jgi:hypothetical protein